MITSSANARIKMLRKLQQRKYRDEFGCYYLEGPRHVLEALEAGIDIDYVVICPELLNTPATILDVLNKHLPPNRILEVSSDTFKGFSLKEGPKGIAAVLPRPALPLADMQAPDWGYVALSSVANPGNLGTILRTCDAVGVDGVILLDRSTDPFDPTALRAGMGAHFTVKQARTEFDELVEWNLQYNLPMIGTSDHAEFDYHHIRYPDHFILIMGSEREGLSPEQINKCDLMVRIPMSGKLDSLNLAVATSIVLYEMYNQKQEKNDR